MITVYYQFCTAWCTTILSSLEKDVARHPQFIQCGHTHNLFNTKNKSYL